MEPGFFKNNETQLLRQDGSTVRGNDVLRNVKYVLVYFSAQWCPACRTFTPLLKQFYERHHVKEDFEVIFVSMDTTEEDMLEYFKEAHGDYYCLNYSDAKIKSGMWGSTYGFQTIPTLLVFENTYPRKLLVQNGRSKVESDPDGAFFPWDLHENPVVRANL